MASRRTPLAERMSQRTATNDNGCIEWQGYRLPQGYGIIDVDGSRRYAHRVAWELANGCIPPGLCVCHRCDNPCCCNIDHLFLGTNADNNADMVAKGRNVVPAGHNRRLTDADVAAIRERVNRGETGSQVAADYGITRQYVSQINTRRRRP